MSAMRIVCLFGVALAVMTKDWYAAGGWVVATFLAPPPRLADPEGGSPDAI